MWQPLFVSGLCNRRDPLSHQIAKTNKHLGFIPALVDLFGHVPGKGKSGLHTSPGQGRGWNFYSRGSAFTLDSR